VAGLRFEAECIEHPRATEPGGTDEEQALSAASKRARHVSAQGLEHSLAPDHRRRREVRAGNALRLDACEARDRREPVHHIERGLRPEGGLEAEQRRDERVE
jgi:hypothetical protein